MNNNSNNTLLFYNKNVSIFYTAYNTRLWIIKKSGTCESYFMAGKSTTEIVATAKEYFNKYN